MGYSTNPELILDNEEFLRELSAKLNGGEVVLSVKGNVSSEQYRLRRILAACDRHPEVLEGEFFGIGRSTRVAVEGPGVLRVFSRGITGVVIKRADEMDALRSLREYSGSMQLLTFCPSEAFDQGAFEETLNGMGWILHKASMTEDDGEISYGVERIEEETSGFSFLGKEE